jgi:hypothetical protein
LVLAHAGNVDGFGAGDARESFDDVLGLQQAVVGAHIAAGGVLFQSLGVAGAAAAGATAAGVGV